MGLYNAFLYRYYRLILKNRRCKQNCILTGQFFKYASSVYKGSDIDAEELGWFIPRKKVNLTTRA